MSVTTSEQPQAAVQIEVDHLWKVFGPHPRRAIRLAGENRSRSEIREQSGCTVAVRDANFQIHEGEVFVIMGLSGCGKSTLIRCLNRLIEPTQGSVRIDGLELTAMDRRQLLELRRSRLAMVFQHFGLLPHRTVLDNVAFGLELRGMDRAGRHERASRAIEQVGLKGFEQSVPRALSGGMQQRVGLARAMACEPEILLMDEAFSALDPLIRRDLQDELLNLQTTLRKTIVFITHDLDEALKIGDRIAIMKDGIIEQIGTPEEILISPASEYIRRFTESVDRSRVITAGSIMVRPDVLGSRKDGPKLALRHMRQSGLSTLYVVTSDRRLAGVARIDDVVAAANGGQTTLESVLVRDVPSTSPDTSLSELLPLASSSSIPIAVLAPDQRLLGIVTRARLLAALAGEV